MSNQGPTSKLSHGLQPRLMKDWDSVRLNLKQVFQSLAEIKADMTIGDSDAAESEQFTWLHLYLTWIAITWAFALQISTGSKKKSIGFVIFGLKGPSLLKEPNLPNLPGCVAEGIPQ